MNRKQRKEERRHLIYYLPVKDPDTEQVIGRLVDITTVGIMLISEKPLKRTFAVSFLFSAEFDKIKKDLYIRHYTAAVLRRTATIAAGFP